MGELSKSDESSDQVLVRVERLKKHFPIRRRSMVDRHVGIIRAVDDISFTINRGKTLGLVGERGCGKSTTGQVILRLLKPTSGKVYYDGIELAGLRDVELRELRPKMQMIFQDSISSLNPRHSVGRLVSEPLQIQRMGSKRDIYQRVVELLELVGLNTNSMKQFPHEFSDGQRQRINIARALALNPRFIVCDEPISALDVTMQAQVVNLFKELKAKLGLTYLFISHDISMVGHISQRVAVMYLGKVMELTDSSTLFRDPLHPYTQSLISAVPIPNPKLGRKRKRIILKGEVPSQSNTPRGCVFNTRCPLAYDECFETVPEYQEVAPAHFVACHLVAQKGSSWIPILADN